MYNTTEKFGPFTKALRPSYSFFYSTVMTFHPRCVTLRGPNETSVCCHVTQTSASPLPLPSAPAWASTTHWTAGSGGAPGVCRIHGWGKQTTRVCRVGTSSVGVGCREVSVSAREAEQTDAPSGALS